MPRFPFQARFLRACFQLNSLRLRAFEVQFSAKPYLKFTVSKLRLSFTLVKLLCEPSFGASNFFPPRLIRPARASARPSSTCIMFYFGCFMRFWFFPLFFFIFPFFSNLIWFCSVLFNIVSTLLFLFCF